MKRFVPPSRTDLSQAYEALQWGKSAPEAEDWIKWAQWARLDPRFAEIMVRALERFFFRLNPFLLWRENVNSSEPQALMVLIEFAALRAPYEFLTWSRTVTDGIPSGAPQTYFIQEGWPRPERDALVATTSLRPYLRWGYFGREDLARAKLDVATRAVPTILGKSERLRILDKLLNEVQAVTVNDYIKACGGCVHRRTAERDLRGHPRVRSTGYTRNKKYF